MRLPPRATRTDTIFPYTTLFRCERLRKVKPCSAERLKDVKPCSAERLRKVKPCSAAFPSCRTRSGIQRAANSPVAALAGRWTPERVRGDGEIGGRHGLETSDMDTSQAPVRLWSWRMGSRIESTMTATTAPIRMMIEIGRAHV